MRGAYAEADCLPLSALQHLAFCERQCALIHIEGLWAENSFTVEGQHLHEKVDSQGSDSRGSVRTARGLPLRCLRLGLVGKADAVEFHRIESAPAVAVRGIRLEDVEGLWLPFPVEYKRGKPKRDRRDEVQLCGQALCLEEMLQTSIPEGALFYGQTRRREPVTFDADLRRETEEVAQRLHRLIASGITPRAAREPKCDNCSLLDLCLPDGNAPGRSAAAYLSAALAGDGERGAPS
ncbi:MAG: CRISPR-associated protein Cas4 [Elusimicrobia bacterium]|nr:CRISPR-associated protein Cas4 [Elusimicrobiota bacterium]